MSAVPQDSSKPSSGPSGTHTFHFKQDVPIPSYLLALAVGDLEFRQIGPRSKVTLPAVYCQLLGTREALKLKSPPPP